MTVRLVQPGEKPPKRFKRPVLPCACTHEHSHHSLVTEQCLSPACDCSEYRPGSPRFYLARLNPSQTPPEPSYPPSSTETRQRIRFLMKEPKKRS